MWASSETEHLDVVWYPEEVRKLALRSSNRREIFSCFPRGNVNTKVLNMPRFRSLDCESGSLGEWFPTFRRNLPPSSSMVQGPPTQDHIPQKRNPRLHLQTRMLRTFCAHTLHTSQSQLSHCSALWKVILKRPKYVEVKLSLYMTRWHIGAEELQPDSFLKSAGTPWNWAVWPHSLYERGKVLR